MMIKINLLPQPNKLEAWVQDQRMQVHTAIGVAVFIVIVGMCWMWTLALNQELQVLLDEKVSKEQISTELKKKSQQIELIQDKHKTLVTRSHLMGQSFSKKFVPVTLMDVISRSLDPLNLWLRRVSVNGENVEIDGRGGQTEDILKFVDTLEQSPIWRNLLAVETKAESYQGFPMYHFTLRFTIDGLES